MAPSESRRFEGLIVLAVLPGDSCETGDPGEGTEGHWSPSRRSPPVNAFRRLQAVGNPDPALLKVHIFNGQLESLRNSATDGEAQLESIAALVVALTVTSTRKREARLNSGFTLPQLL